MTTEARESKAHNVALSRDGDDLVIRVNLKNAGKPSSTGKTTVIGSSGGFLNVPGLDKAWVSLNVMRK